MLLTRNNVLIWILLIAIISSFSFSGVIYRDVLSDRAEILSASEEILSGRAEISVLENGLQDVSEEARSLGHKLDVEKQDRKILEEELSGQGKQVVLLQEKLSDQDVFISALDGHLQDAVNKAKILEADLEKERQIRGILEIESSRQTNEIKKLQAEGNMLQADLVLETKARERLAGDHASLKADLEALKGKILTTVEELLPTAAKVYDIAKHGVVSIAVYDSSDTYLGVGSGFVYSNDGYVVTNDHVVTEGTSYVLTFLDGSMVTATLVGTDTNGDIAVLHAELTKYAKPLSLGDSLSLKVGEPAYAMGSPHGLVGSFTTGIVSYHNRIVTEEDYGYPTFLPYIQTDAAINPGNSGGPLLNEDGEVIGMNTLGYIGSDGLGFAIPSSILKKVVPSLIDTGSYDYPVIGIGGYFIDPILADEMDLPSSVTSGWLITYIFEGSGAFESELEIGDIILKIDGYKIQKEHDISVILNQFYSPGDSVKLKVLRESNILFVDVILGSR